MTKAALLALSDGTVFEGISIGADGSSVGELVFNTSMTGYQEMLTDPSYARQIITLTYPHVGNVGCNPRDYESSRVWASGLVIRDSSLVASNYRSQHSLSDWLKAQNVVAIAELDTRHLTHYLRDNGAQNACITTDVANPQQAIDKARAFSGLEGCDLAIEVTTKESKVWDADRDEWGQGLQPGRFNVVAYDFGVKHNILRILKEKGCNLTVVPADTPVEQVQALNPDGVFLSNGPGDPAACHYALENVKQLLEMNVPMFGICLGFQILSLACGARSLKMKFGHHGANHPVTSCEGEKRVFITSQNHGFAIDEDSLPETLVVTHRSLFDNSLQGVRHKAKPVFGFQGHPEASPGPNDIECLFDQFVSTMEHYRSEQ